MYKVVVSCVPVVEPKRLSAEDAGDCGTPKPHVKGGPFCIIPDQFAAVASDHSSDR